MQTAVVKIFAEHLDWEDGGCGSIPQCAGNFSVKQIRAGKLYQVAPASFELGWNVCPVASGKEALSLASERAVPFDIVLSDLVMPGLSGRE